MSSTSWGDVYTERRLTQAAGTAPTSVHLEASLASKAARARSGNFTEALARPFAPPSTSELCKSVAKASAPRIRLGCTAVLLSGSRNALKKRGTRDIEQAEPVDRLTEHEAQIGDDVLTCHITRASVLLESRSVGASHARRVSHKVSWVNCVLGEVEIWGEGASSSSADESRTPT